MFCSFWHTRLETFGLAPALRRVATMAGRSSLQAIASVSAVSPSYKDNLTLLDCNVNHESDNNGSLIILTSYS